VDEAEFRQAIAARVGEIMRLRAGLEQLERDMHARAITVTDALLLLAEHGARIGVVTDEAQAVLREAPDSFPPEQVDQALAVLAWAAEHITDSTGSLLEKLVTEAAEHG
jgi:hypothetical protein